MATSLFGNMGGLDQTALDFAKLSPTQQSAYLIGSGARGAAEGIGGLMGMQTKQKQMQNLMQQYNVTTSQGLRDLANAIRNTDPQGALSLIAKADEMDLAQAKTQSEQAQTFQRMQAGYKSQVETAKPPSVGQTAELIAQGEYGKPFNELTPEQKKEVVQRASKTASASVGTTAELIAQAKYGKTFSQLTPQEKQAVAQEASKKTSLGEGLAALGAGLGKQFATTAGKDIAESVAPTVIQGKEDTISALNRAKELLDKGIYTGGMANAAMTVSKYTPFGSQKKLENTEKYIAYVSTTVIPLLKEFGGNDSNEELTFLKRLVGGEITLEEGTLKEIIDSAITKVSRSIQRTQDNVKNVSQGGMPSTEVKPQQFGANLSPIKKVEVGQSVKINGVTIKRVE